MARLEQIIVVDAHRGKGEHHDPHRMVTEYWSADGRLLAEFDILAPQYDAATGRWRLQQDTTEFAPKKD